MKTIYKIIDGKLVKIKEEDEPKEKSSIKKNVYMIKETKTK